MKFYVATFSTNDIAMLQHAHETGAAGTVLYPETHFASSEWRERVERDMVPWAQSLGFEVKHTAPRMKLLELIEQAGQWPTPSDSFCRFIKQTPTERRADELDPTKKIPLAFSIRRDDGAHRYGYPTDRANTDGRRIEYPIVSLGDHERDALVRRAGFEPTPRRERNCFPCVYSNSQDLADLSGDALEAIGVLETKLGAPMYNPVHVAGAKSIYEVVERAKAGLRFADTRCPCDRGWCGG
jgi:hypothetical protein